MSLGRRIMRQAVRGGRSIRHLGRGGRSRRPFVRTYLLVDLEKPRLKTLLHHFGVFGWEFVLGRQIALRPSSRLISRVYRRQLLNQAFAKTR
jgi:hypothetical protein